MTNTSSGLFRSTAKAALRELDVPLLTCRGCVKRRPMTIKSIVPRLRASEGAEIAYQCADCGETERRFVKPV